MYASFFTVKGEVNKRCLKVIYVFPPLSEWCLNLKSLSLCVEQWHELPNFPNPKKWGYSMVSLNNDVYVTGEWCISNPLKYKDCLEQQDNKQQNLLVSFVRTAHLTECSILSDRGLSRLKYQYLVDHRDLEVHHKRGEVGYCGTHAAASD